MKRPYIKISIQRFITVAMTLLLTLTSSTLALAKEAEDTYITNAINTEMMVDNAIYANNVDVTTKDGVVILKGTVNNILAKERALALAEAIVGVRAVVNMVEVIPTSPRDDKDLSNAVMKAWLDDPAADSYELNANVDNGIVTMSGTVQSYAEMELSETVAKGVKGVKGIKNKIEVKYTTNRADSEIKNEIAERLMNDIRIDEQFLEVKVNKGDVTLSGTVGSLQEKTLAGSDALLAGVRSVDDSSLEVKWWARDEIKDSNSYVKRTDEDIKKAVKASFVYDPRVLSFNPTVEVSYGTVTLSGMVDNLKAKHAAEQDAMNTLGTMRVKNYLKVRPNIPTNEVLKKRVAEALLNNPYVERYEINIDAFSGWIYLSGEVNTLFEMNQADRVAEGVKGVVGVVNKIVYNNRWVWKPDWEIQEDVKEQLWWSPFVDEVNIKVSVDEGVVTLNGTVETWSENDDAEKNAFQGGAKDVINNLIVKYHYYGTYGPGYYGSHNYQGLQQYRPYFDPYN